MKESQQSAIATAADILRDGFGRESQVPNTDRRVGWPSCRIRALLPELLNLVGATGIVPGRFIRSAGIPREWNW